MRIAIALLVCALATSTTSAAQLLSAVQWNIWFGETSPNVDTLHMFIDGTELNFNPKYADIGAGNQVVYDGAEFPWHPASGGEGLRLEFNSGPGKNFNITVPMGGMPAGQYDNSVCNSNLPDPCGGHYSQPFPDPTYDYIVFNLNDYSRESVSLPDDINYRTNIGATVLFYGGAPPTGPEPSSLVLLALGGCGILGLRPRK
jgi:PEP-CTERM motif